ncbi:SRPBCC family protein [Bacillus timonensis]|nr:SRPBCC family protein [Bacillus timonensis]
MSKVVDVLTKITIECPVEQVAEYAANPEHAPKWYDNIHSAEWITEKNVRVGSKIAFKAKFLGRDLSYVYEIMEYIPGEKLVMKTANGPFPMETIYTWDRVGTNYTEMTLRNKGNPTGFSKWISPFMSTMIRRANMKDLKKIKDILETRH